MRVLTKVAIAGVISILSLGIVPAAQAATPGHQLAPNMVVGCCK